ncbi:NeuD/PglB/VioB family sugar acetyltransferase [Mediterraneibacter glycyrrhizinilyticus]|uniref:NeuD/PglB/VioB family sugar acetyltransferase n=1 Tax=Mediterraneibacter glycyrrhizinilyticus TaxID=342942 RepID=UPI00265B2217|nr:NeuD/PglB/VioB family sugar acetyltransferase [Mediterraneibacter glycyrrhizinilyticus]MCF2569062.1 NeuD/PglB/VioB family sugar acetyltransferase [Mediterraneibacter glycyrrhizinilyticus]
MILAIYGAGGTGKAICDEVLRAEKERHTYEEVVFVDDVCGEKECYGLRVFTFEEVKETFQTDEIEFLIAMGDPAIKEKIFQNVEAAGYGFAVWIHPKADVSPSAKIGAGTYIDNCYIDNNVVLGRNVIVYPQAIIGHDTQIKDHCIVSVRTFMGGHCILEDQVYYGPCAAARDGIHIGKGAVIGVNAALYKDVPEYHTAIGNPARNMARAKDKVF